MGRSRRFLGSDPCGDGNDDVTLERFQEDTVQAAVQALTDAAGSRRFLVADEVGLGKTVSAKAIATALQRRAAGPLNVVYLCPNLDIASQNLAKLTALQPDWPPPEDRLSLVLRDRPEAKLPFRIYSYTPETSLPGWKSGQRTGRMAERDLVGGLLRRCAPLTWRRLRAADRDRMELGTRRFFSEHLDEPPARLVVAFGATLRELTLLVGRPLDRGLSALLDGWGDDAAELILRCRAALALAALRDPVSRPDLLILDEFHRYADLIVPAGTQPADTIGRDRHRVQRELVNALVGNGASGPAVLLLSATPYRLQRLDHGEIPGGRYGHFIQLVRFLYGSQGEVKADGTEAAIKAHHAALSRRDDPTAAKEDVSRAKRALEELLRPVIARTERATAIGGDLFERHDTVGRVEAGDLVTFRHFARSVARRKGALRNWVQPLWSSVPYPAETLFDYNVCRALGSDLPSATIASGRARPDHPQLRSLVDPDGPRSATISVEALMLPWLPPTQPWWPLGGRWRGLAEDRRLCGKALLFSRFRGTPWAVASWLSGEVERRAGTVRGRSATKAQAYLRPDAKNPWPLIALFMPWPTLAKAIRVRPARDLREARRTARDDLRAWLVGEKIELVPATGPARRPWRTAFDLEQLHGGANLIVGSLVQLGRLVRPRSWQRRDAVATITAGEADALADWLLGAPGAIVARTLIRHPAEAMPRDESETEKTKRMVAEQATAFRFCWRQLRPYLGQRHFAQSVVGLRRRKLTGGYPEALRQALVDGGLEATLDEHVAVTRLVSGGGALEVLAGSIVGRPGRVRRRTTRGIRAARVHAAVPYLGAERRGEASGSTEKLRSDILRKAFNSPFWPHVLATTSIGQEGLDFHVWCDRVMHWDLPRDPVDFEQREGRISRYASLGVRRALVDEFGGGDIPDWSSPFQRVFDAARAGERKGFGLERWWSPTGHRPVSVTFSLPFSAGGERLRRLRDELVRYRLALGQPEPQLFEAMVEHLGLDGEQARMLALNLSPALPVCD